MSEQQVLEEMIAWLDRRIEEVPDGKVYKEMKENLKWELKTVLGRLEK